MSNLVKRLAGLGDCVWPHSPSEPPVSSAPPVAVNDTATEVDALAALLASDQGGNEASLQATVNIIAVVLAYLAGTLFVVIGPGMELPLGVLLAIPAPILLLQTLQMVLAAGVVARSASAERIEEALSRHLTPGAPIAEDFEDGRIGSRTSGRITDIRHVGGIGAVTAQAPYVGFYLLSMLFTAYVLYRAFILAGGDSGLRLVCVVAVAAYSTYLALFAVAALKSFGAAADPDGVSPQMQVGNSRLSISGHVSLSSGRTRSPAPSGPTRGPHTAVDVLHGLGRDRERRRLVPTDSVQPAGCHSVDCCDWIDWIRYFRNRLLAHPLPRERFWDAPSNHRG